MNLSQALSSSVKVAVRVRPFNKREKKAHSKCIIRMQDHSTFIIPPEHVDLPEEQQSISQFTFDYSFWSLETDLQDVKTPFVDQADVFNQLGTIVIDNAYQGYNCAVLAYGQTGSGKSHTQMGGNTPETEGLIPRICRALFQKKAEEKTSSNVRYTIDISYFEIYAEQINDLLSVNKKKTNLNVREHPKTGPYVDGLNKFAVETYDELYDWMMKGNKVRATAATNMNDRSSRSHSIFIVTFTQHFTSSTGKKASMISKINMVDLAGSERVKDSGVEGVHLKEAININKSLTTLGRVISALAKMSTNKKKKALSTPVHVPFRDSVLTWILKDSLGGNSKTVMIATISPAAINYEESMSTLLYASHAKEIVNEVTVNADNNDKLIQDMRNDIKLLQDQMKSLLLAGLLTEEDRQRFAEYQARISQDQGLLNQLSETYEQRLERTHKEHASIMSTQRQRIRKLSDDMVDNVVNMKQPYLLNVSNDIHFSKELINYLAIGEVDGVTISPALQCKLVYDGSVTKLHPTSPNAKLFVNNIWIVNECVLEDGDRIHADEHDESFKYKHRL